MGRINVGVVGFGKMGILHAGILNALSNGRVRSVCESEKMIARAARKILPEVSFYQDTIEMVKTEDLDALFVTSPVQTHVPIIESVMDIRKNLAVFAEKPLASHEPDAARVAETSRAQGIVNMVGFQKRFSPVFRHAKQLLEKGAIGDPQFFRSHCFVSDIFRRGDGWRFKQGSGGVLLDLGPHLVDLLLWYLGDMKPVSAVKKSFYSTEVEDYVHATLEAGSGVVGSLEVCWSIRGYRLPEIFLEINGTNGSLVVTDDYIRAQADNEIVGVISAGNQLIQKTAFNTSVEFLLADPEFTLQDQHFLAAVETKKSTQPDFHVAARVNQMIDMIHQQADT